MGLLGRGIAIGELSRRREIAPALRSGHSRPIILPMSAARSWTSALWRRRSPIRSGGAMPARARAARWSRRSPAPRSS